MKYALRLFALFTTALAAWAGACTFPAVDYADASSCELEGDCANQATSCGSDAVDQLDCQDKCRNGMKSPKCTECQQDLLKAREACLDECKNCGSQQCADPEPSCRKLIGLP